MLIKSLKGDDMRNKNFGHIRVFFLPFTFFTNIVYLNMNFIQYRLYSYTVIGGLFSSPVVFVSCCLFI